ncbi:MAG: F0F1 ATP synthase subunit delta [Proteobacteria bacterium]|jgi:F-type H+-transporting ATPase subunit delta|nr:F0F1 ATP synthase subunit delta [Pseudomonadota bacterium]
MPEIATIARPYANAIFELAKSKRALDGWSRELAVLAAVAAEPSIKDVIDSPAATSVQKANSLARVCGDDLSREGKQLLQVLAGNRRLHLLAEIGTQYEELRAQEQATLEVEVVSAYALDDAEQTRIIEALARRFEREIVLTSRVDESLLGGAIIRAGDTVIDGSVRGKLEKLSETLQRT